MGCKAHISLRASADGKTLQVKSLENQHNHETNPVLFKNLYQQRQMDEASKENVRQMLDVKANRKIIQANMMKSTGKVILLKDIHNLKRKMNAQNDDVLVLQNAVDEFSKCDGAFVKILTDETNEMTGLFFQDERMRKVFSEFPEFICVDATYKVNNLRMPLYLLVVENGQGLSEIAGLWLLANETEEHLQIIVNVFKEQNPNWNQIKTVMTDKDMVEREVFKRSFPGVNLRICLYHVLKSFRREITAEKMGVTGQQRENVLDILQKLAYAKTEQEYAKYKDQLRETKLDKVFNYFVNSWDEIRSQWVVGLTCSASYGNRTNNRVESINQKIKQVIDKHSKLDTFAADLVYFLNAHRTQINAKICKTANKISITRHPQASKEYKYQQILTSYAYQLIHPELEAVKTDDRVTDGTTSENVDQINETLNDSCTCVFYQQFKLPCRHILSLRLKNGQDVFDPELVPSRWTKAKNLDILGTNIIPTELQTESFTINKKPKSQQEKFRQCFRLTQKIASLVSESCNSDYDVKIQQLERILSAWNSGESVTIASGMRQHNIHVHLPISPTNCLDLETPSSPAHPSDSQIYSNTSPSTDDTHTLRNDETSHEVRPKGDIPDTAPTPSAPHESLEYTPEVVSPPISPLNFSTSINDHATPVGNQSTRNEETRNEDSLELNFPVTPPTAITTQSTFDSTPEITSTQKSPRAILPTPSSVRENERKKEFLSKHGLTEISLPPCKKNKRKT